MMVATKTYARDSRSELVASKLEEVLRIGGLMSNVCYNVAQSSTTDRASLQTIAGSLFQKWDQALREYRATRAGKPRSKRNIVTRKRKAPR